MATAMKTKHGVRVRAYNERTGSEFSFFHSYFYDREIARKKARDLLGADVSSLVGYVDGQRDGDSWRVVQSTVSAASRRSL